MGDRNSELLFEYLRSILYDSKIKTLDASTLDASFQKLGLGLNYLEQAVTEMKQYSAALSKGNLSVEAPSRENFLCENLKNIHANLNHLTWQAKQVAKGDYSQTVSYLGEFSEAFNTMTQQLQEREQFLKQEAEMEKTHANMVESYNQLLIELIDRSEEEVLVTSVDGEEILYHNQKKDHNVRDLEIYKICLEFAKKGSDSYMNQSDSYEWVWETECSNHRFYRIITGYMEWQGEMAYTHIIRETTAEKEKEERLEAEAHHDTLTEIGNRYFFQEKMDELLKTGENLVFCYCDLDHLKYVNDTFGHLEGDNYIRSFVETIKQYLKPGDVFARIGGDEFCIILRGCRKKAAEEKMYGIQNIFSKNAIKEYPQSFSCGVLEVPQGHSKLLVNDIIHQADSIMYAQKKKHKEQYQRELAFNEKEK